MTTRVYLTAPIFADGNADPTDLPAERIFVNASEVPEIWVETESAAVADVGKVASFYIGRSLAIGFSRISGTVERKIQK
jgi:hypothetical protein